MDVLAGGSDGVIPPAAVLHHVRVSGPVHRIACSNELAGHNGDALMSTGVW